MAFQEVSSVRKYVKYAECKKGETIAEGWYYQNQEDPEYGRTYILRTPEGEDLGLGAAGQLKHKFMVANITFEDYIKVIYEGRAKYPGCKAPQGVHQFTLLVDPSRRGKRLDAGFKPVGEEADDVVPF